MHTVFALLCFVVVIHWLIFPYPSGLLHWHCGNLTIAPVPAKQPWWIWINTSCELIMNDCITTTKQSTTKPCAYFLGYTVFNYDKYVLGQGVAELYWQIRAWGQPNNIKNNVYRLHIATLTYIINKTKSIKCLSFLYHGAKMGDLGTDLKRRNFKLTFGLWIPSVRAWTSI